MVVNGKTINVLLVEDSEVTRAGLKRILAQYTDFRLVGEANNGRAAIERALALRPDVVIMDIGMPIMDGVEAAQQVKTQLPSTRVIMLTVHDSDAHIFSALSAGAHGYCLKTVSGDQLALAIRTVADGAAWLDPRIANRVLQSYNPTGAGGEAEASGGGGSIPLSAREVEVLRLVVEGLTNQKIAERLVVSIETVKSHMRRIMEKLAVSDRTQAAVRAVRDKLI
jgi:two-component system, NarL family, response regulator LiaR